MGLNDTNNQLVAAQAVTATVVTTNSQQLPATGADIGMGEPMGMEFALSAVSAVSGTIQFQIVSATNADGTTGSVVLNTTPAITDTDLAAGDIITLAFPVGLIPLIADDATHVAGKFVIASSGTCTATVNIKPLAACRGVQYQAAQPTMDVFA